MATKEEQDALRLLVQHVSRGFYEPRFIIIMDMLARYPVLKDDDLAGRLGLQAKELNKIMAILTNDRLVKVHRQNELKEGAQRSVGRQYYYIDYQDFCNVVKWRIHRMHKIIDSSSRKVLDTKGYVCPQCGQSYSQLDALELLDQTTGFFICEVCHTEVVENQNTENEKGSNDRMQKFHHQMRFVRAGLQKSETMVLPAFDVAAWVRSNVTVETEKTKGNEPGAGLKIAGSGQKTESAGIGIMMTEDKDEATKKQERDARAEAKRQQNALPAWHLKSTITGDLTALGEKERARAEQAKLESAMNFNDDILKGLGVAGTNKGTSSSGITLVADTTADVKPVIDHEATFYEKYYDSLAATSNSSAQDTPVNATAGDDFGGEDDEDSKPTVQYLNSLNDYRKRSRTKEDEGLPAAKIARVEEPPKPNIPQPDIVPVVAPAEMADDPLISVAGKLVPFSKVTEEDHELMTPEEYTAYYEVLAAQ